MKTCMVQANPKCQRQLQVGVPHRGDDVFYLQKQNPADQRYRVLQHSFTFRNTNIKRLKTKKMLYFNVASAKVIDSFCCFS